MATFFNQATLNYNGGVTASNVTEGELLELLSMTKTALSTSYSAGDGVIYAVSILNSGAAPVSGVTLTDDLGAYTPVGGTAELTPLDYVAGSLRLFINGSEAMAPAVTSTSPLTTAGFTVPAGATATLIYEAIANGNAPATPGSTVVNTATVTADGVAAPLTDTATVTVRERVGLTIAKAICPQTVTDGGELTYTFVIQNSGNVEVIATDDVTVNDLFNPILSDITVTLNGTALTEGVGYTYDEATGAFATLPGQITVPAATYGATPAGGGVTVIPGVAVLTVTGTV